ncbi:MAG: NUDIX hydrolase [Chloroflexi bacterium]|nr:NUDIX hydrolase [Chloroflexota bacterium]
MPESPPARVTVFDGHLLRLVLQQMPRADGGARQLEIVEHPDGAAIVAVDEQQRVLLVRQARPAIGQHLLELPAGVVDPGESPLQTAHRELEEETGYRAEQLELLASFYTSPGFCTERLYVYLANGLQAGTPADDPDEPVEIVRLQVDQALASRQISDAKTLVGLLAYRQRLATGTG